MLTLALDTATFVATVAITEEDSILAEIAWGVQRNHSERVLPAIDYALREVGIKMSDIGRIAVSAGPGSFTGLRIGMSLAKGLAEGLGVPVVAVSTLRVLAEQSVLHEGLIVPLLSAQREQYYGAIFTSCEAQITEYTENVVVGLAELEALLRDRSAQVLLTGEAAPQVGKELGLRVAPAVVRVPRAGVLGILSANCPALVPRQLRPNYIRPSSAQPRKGSEV